MIDLKTYVQQPHPAAKIFKNHGISLKAISVALGIDYSYTSSMLSGLRNPTLEMENKIQDLINQLSMGKKKKK